MKPQDRARFLKIKAEHEASCPRRGGGNHGEACMCWWHREGWLIHQLESMELEVTITRQAIQIVSDAKMGEQ